MSRPIPWLSRALVLVSSVVIAACSSSSTTEPLAVQANRAIVGGVSESGYPGVGAMTFVYPGQGYGGSFCTGTLVHTNWVLTAAHCMDEVAGIDLQSNPNLVHFMIGTNANPGSSGPINGTLYQADAIYVHHQYDAQNQDNDIALVHLRDAAPSAHVIGINYVAMNNTSTWVAQDVLYVGFGATEGVNSTGGGTKRSGSNPIDAVYPGMYQSDATGGTGVCFGDSGGPGLMMVSGDLVVIGVNSGVGGSPSSDPCLGYGTHTRMDDYTTWFDSYVGGQPPDCNFTSNMCQCTQACQTDGTCNNTACQVNDCEGMASCMDACPTNDDGCYIDCYWTGTDQGKADYDALQQCMATNCENASDMSACIQANCLSLYQTCFPASNCDVTGGDCPSGEACYPASGGGTDCFDTNGKLEGATCNPNLTSTLDCADGLLCISFSSTSRCMPMCTDNNDCDGTEYCYEPIFTNVTGIGVCLCVDDDNDGYCATEDCDDNNAQSFPGATERCGDNQDNDCDGETDEGCTTCVDNDHDGYCATDDCDDANGSINPGAAEFCGDSIDNNCDGNVDENCGSCTDADQDGYCATVDCDDNDALGNPGAAERCGDSIDNDCDGNVDEGCANCADHDGDGYCADVDCEDNNALVYPGAAETCHDGLDNNCNMAIDEGCVCVDDDLDGYCAGPDCDDADPYANPGGVEVCGDNQDNDCDGFVDEDCGGAPGGGCNTADATPGATGVLLLLFAFGLLIRRRPR